MCNYYCFICNSHITNNIYKAYDQNFCSILCRKNFIKNYNYTSNFTLIKKLNPITNTPSSVYININQYMFTEYNEYKINPHLNSHKINNDKNMRNVCINIYNTGVNEQTSKNMNFYNIVSEIIKKLLNY